MKSNNSSCRPSRLLFLALSLLISVTTVELAVTNKRKGNSTLVLLQNETNITDVKLQFQEFQNIFEIKGLPSNSIDFMSGSGLSILMKYLENTNYSTLIYVLNNNNTRDAGYCDMAEHLSEAFKKDVLFWPCPRMKLTERFLPSFEIISFVVTTISKELNWTEAVIFATETNWGLPLAISANIQIPFRIEIGTTNLDERQIADKKGQVVIITSSLNSIEAQQVIQHFEHYRQTKLFLIDMFGTIFNSESHFYTYLGGNFTKIDNIFLTWSSGLVPNNPDFSENSFRNSSTNNRGNSRPYRNLLVLTVLTEKLKHLLNKTLHVEFEKYSEWMLKEAFVDDNSDDIAISSVSVKRDRRHIPYNNNTTHTKESLDFSQRIYNDSEVSSDVEKTKV
ncbi:uncharacterized protein LOC129799446 [Phlebotomus papatasi]|uniref:uncharacterized protein LOC129799446 n=1 Tax=Phlebotomus papatasi TaxID=29031 RepID=UPI00248354AE|nr:uncharacterized protein LOC129799446 [Phlebotomus papatasi]